MLEAFTDYMALEMVSPVVGLAVIGAIFLSVSAMERRAERSHRKEDA